MADAPFSLYVDLPAIASITAASGTATVTTSSAHGLIVGDYIQIEGVTTTTAWNSVYQISAVASATEAKFVSATTGSATITSAIASRNMLNPLANYASAYRSNAVIVPISSVTMGKSGDGGGGSFGFVAIQDATPASGPWFANLPDNARVRLVKAATSSVPSSTESDVQFKGLVSSIDCRLNGGGVGTFCTVSVDDVNILLDKLTVNGSPSVRELTSLTLASNTKITATTKTPHQFAVGQKIRFKGVLMDHTTSQRATKSVINQPTEFTIESVDQANGTIVTTANPGFASSNITGLRISIGSASGTSPASIKNSKDRVTVFPGASSFHNLTAADVGTRVWFNSTTSGALVTWLSECELVIDAIVSEAAGGGIVLRALSGRPRPSNFAVSITSMRSYPEVDLTTPAGVGEYLVGSQTSETALVQQFFTKALQQNYQYDATLKRLLDVTDTSGVATLAGVLPEPIVITADTLQSALDTVVEQFSGVDGLERRYWIGTNRKLYYTTTSGTAVTPTYANAPIKIVTDSAGNPNASPSTIAASELSVNSRHTDIVKRLTVYPKSGTQSVKLYSELGYTARSGPVLEARLDAPTATSKSGIERAAKAFFLENAKPITSGSFTLSGYSTASYNDYGFMGGVYQTGAATYATATSWEPGQYVSIVAASLNLNGLYRVETVDVEFEPSSFVQRITVGFSRRPVGTLSDVVGSKR